MSFSRTSEIKKIVKNQNQVFYVSTNNAIFTKIKYFLAIFEGCCNKYDDATSCPEIHYTVLNVVIYLYI